MGDTGGEIDFPGQLAGWWQSGWQSLVPGSIFLPPVTGIHNFVYSSSLTLAVCMNSSGYSLCTSAHVLQNFENGLEYLFNLKLLVLCKSLLRGML